MIRSVLLLGLFTFLLVESSGQCASTISSFPYTEGFETSDGGWTSGGAGNDWAWGTPAKAIINTAGGGTKCWITGGLTSGAYTNGEASWLQSPCFDFSTLPSPYISFKINWETEQQFDGASFQYSIDDGNTWITIGPANYTDCTQKNWFNQDPVTYLSPLTTERRGWSGNSLPASGSCRGGNGSNGWVTATTIAPGLGSRTSVIFRFIFGAGTICNNYDGFAVDDIYIGSFPPNDADFSYTCVNSKMVSFKNESALCPTTFNWDFGDPGSGASNTSTLENPSHLFSAAGQYTVTLTVDGPGNSPSTITQQVTILELRVDMSAAVNCETNTGGSLLASAGPGGPFNYTWNTVPAQTGITATNLSFGTYTVIVTGAGVCPASATGKAELDLSCTGIYFPSGFTPNGDGKNDVFGPVGSIAAMNEYSFRVYNRWGEIVFSSTNPFKKWDGTFRGAKTDGNVFVWQAEYKQAGSDEKLFRKGAVTLIR